MSGTRKIKVQNILQSQIPSFLNEESPLFKDFLTQYYISETHETGVYDIANYLNEYKNIETYTSNNFYTSVSKNNCFLIENLASYEDTIYVNSTNGFPNKYGLLKINDEIITYKGKTENSFIDCVRGFSGISEINDDLEYSGLIFSDTVAEDHSSKSTVTNLNLVFYSKLFEKFKFHYLPDFEKRELNSNIDLNLILSRARDFYLTKGSDISFKILFEILYNTKISIFKPKENIIKTTSGINLNTKNILVELINGEFNPLNLKGYTITQEIENNITASASIYNVEFRPVDSLNLYEFSLDSESIVYDFTPTQKTIVIEEVSNGVFVDSTIGFPDSGRLYAKIKLNDLDYKIETYSYNGKCINKFLNVEGSVPLKAGDELIEDKLLKVITDDLTEVEFRLLNTLKNFDFTSTNGLKVNDTISLSSFGESFEDMPEFDSWIYNYPTYHNIKSKNKALLTLYGDFNFINGDNVTLINQNNIGYSTVKVTETNQSNIISVNTTNTNDAVKVKKNIKKSPLNPLESCYIQNTYYDKINNSVIVASSGLPSYNGNITQFNQYSFKLKGQEDSFNTLDFNNNIVKHYLSSGTKVYLSSSISGISTGEYFVKKINDTKISLFKGTLNLSLSYSNSEVKDVTINSNVPVEIGSIVILSYKDITNNYSNQLLLKEFKVADAISQNKSIMTSQIYNIEDAWNMYKP